MKDFFYSVLVPTSIAVGGWYKDEIKQYFKTFRFKERWHHIVYITLILNIITMVILIVGHR